MKRLGPVIILLAIARASLAAPASQQPTLWLNTFGPDMTGMAKGSYASAVFRCGVIAGPKLVGCVPSSASDQNASAGDLAAWLEATPACLVSPFKVGSTQSIGVVSLPGQPLSHEHYAPPDWDKAHTRMSEVAIVLSQVHAVYAQQPLQGAVMLKCSVGVDGRATGCVLEAQSKPDVGLGGNALRAAKVFRFLPERRDCEPVGGAKVRIPIRTY